MSSNSEHERMRSMSILKVLETIFFWPGDAVRRWLGLTVEHHPRPSPMRVIQAFWGTVAVIVALRYFV